MNYDFTKQKKMSKVTESSSVVVNYTGKLTDGSVFDSSLLEGREPLLDHRIIEFVAQLPFSYKFDGKSGKKILKDIVHSYIPKSMMDRPKAGFSLPIYEWLRSDLSYMVDEYLSEESLKMSGLLNEKWIQTQIELFKENKLHYQPLIWNLLMFQMWYKKWVVEQL